MAILTGDQAYCASCFKCKACKRPIEDLRYARTSKGLFCMPCHHKLVERKRKYEAVKSRNFVSSQETQSSADTTTPSDEKRYMFDELDGSKPLSATEKVQVTSPPKVTKSPVLQKVEGSPIPGRSDKQEELLTIPLRSPNRNATSPNLQPVTAFKSPKVEDLAEINMATPTPLKADRSPISLNGVVSPGNRNAVIFDKEPDSFIDLSDEDEDDSYELDVDLKQAPNPTRSPSKKPPSGTIPQTPDTQLVSPFKGLNITGLPLEDGEQREQYPSTEIIKDKENTGYHSRKSSGGFGRSLSIKNVFHRHKKSNSGTGLDKNKIQILRDAGSPLLDQDELLKTPDFGSPLISHKHTHSDLTVNPFSLHARSRSDVVYEENQPEWQILQLDQQVKQLKAEITSLTSAKATLMRDIQSLTSEKNHLEDDITLLKEQREKLESGAVPEVKEVESTESPSFTQSDDTLPELSSRIAQHSRKMNSVEDLSEKPKKGGFIRRIFGNGGQTSQYGTNMVSSPSVQSIGSPKNFRQMDESFNTSQEEIEEPKPAGGLSAMIKSRSSNFLRGSAYPLGKSLYQCTLQERAELETRAVPFVFSCCLAEIESRGIREGIYRVSGSSLAIDKIERFFETVEISNEKEVNKVSSILEGDINAVAGMLKRYLKKIPDPVIPFKNYEQFIEVSKLQSEADKYTGLKGLLHDLPQANFIVLQQLSKHMGLVVRNSRVTKMTYSSLATVFAPTLARDNTFNPQREILDNGAKTAVTEFLFRNHEDLFTRTIA
ncbi:hypothetical protein KL925_003765 [Ogataea polymorpha]|nr:hypothetical protein KL906_003420 [Ogataea polymorpha]KAG7926003.1 hypothetical protein KL925_003765 [Ogataea polymorpha]